MGKLLIVSWGIPPSIAGSATIVSQLATGFSREEVVLAGEPPGQKRLFGNQPRDVGVVHLRLPRNGKGENTLRFWSTPVLAWRIRKVVIEMGCTSMLAVFPDEAYLAAAWYAARQTRCRLYPYFHNTYLENRTGWRRQVARWLQPRVFAQADYVYVMSQGMVELYERNYPQLKRCSALVHTFSEAIPPFAQPDPPGNPLRFAFSGNVNQSCLDAARRLFQAVQQVSDAQLDFYSGLPRSYLEQIGVWTARSSCQHITSRPDLLRRLHQADILLLPHGFTGSLSPVEYETIFPTKTIEYLISGKPILAHTPPGAYLTRFLKQHDCALVVDTPDPAAIAAAIRQLRHDAALRARLVRNALKAAEQFQTSRVVGQLRDKLGFPTCKRDS